MIATLADEPSTIDELTTALRNHTFCSFPGADATTYLALRPKALLQLRSLWKPILADRASWGSLEDSPIVVILIPGKPATDRDSYLPIALLSCI